MLLLVLAGTASAQSSITLAWNANTETNIAGYTVSWGAVSGTYTSTVDVRNVTTYTVNGLNPDQRYYFVVKAYNTAGLYSAPSTPVNNNGVIIQTGAVVQDLRPSLFWHNESTGLLTTWLMSGPNVLGSEAISIPGVSDVHWKVAATGDLNGDGSPDLLWRNDVDGTLAVWFLQNNVVVGTQYLSIPKMADPNWRIAGMGDIDGDRCADIIWEYVDGSIAAWLMRGATVVSTQFLSVTRVDPRWQIQGVVDVNGDGMADLIWRDSTEGWLATWYLNGTTVTSTNYLSINKMTDTNWLIEATARTDATSPPALVWRHQVTGAVALWYLQGNVVTSTYWANPSVVDDLNWKIVGGR